jgi:hypothetical protein
MRYHLQSAANTRAAVQEKGGNMKKEYAAPSVREIGGVAGFTEALGFGPVTDFRGRRGFIPAPTTTPGGIS